jgi:hypothetical protein
MNDGNPTGRNPMLRYSNGGQIDPPSPLIFMKSVTKMAAIVIAPKSCLNIELSVAKKALKISQ